MANAMARWLKHFGIDKSSRPGQIGSSLEDFFLFPSFSPSVGLGQVKTSMKSVTSSEEKRLTGYLKNPGLVKGKIDQNQGVPKFFFW